ncbi:helix-turn-helix domain-containing protein [Kribbella sp. NBC_01245]|uniref:helix-turn-helix domain-containing protein n=1 Tax=Kribbella sp. NBC_01245 TaxID=2903578 RepID=UPI002E2CB86B|nr:helix-turn-helix transcriptional regulator [Kribbella sp. NBC_01245]
MADALARNIDLQMRWYGEPLGDRFRRLLDGLSLSQAQLAGALGLSAPMLSQLMSGQRAKISNPAVLSRLLQLEAMAAEPGWTALPDTERQRRLEEVRAAQSTTLTVDQGQAHGQSQASAQTAEPADQVAAIQTLLRELASAAELEGAATLLDEQYPEIAEALRVLGTGRTQDARAFYTRITST